MPREILIYNDVTSYSARDFVESVNTLDGSEDLVVRINTDGGSPEYNWGMVAKFLEYEGKKKVKVDGKAYSAGFFFTCYADEVEALDVSNFLIHRAAYPSWFEQSETLFTEAMKKNLMDINKGLEAAFKKKVDVQAFEEMTGYKVKDVFSMNDRLDVFLTAKEAKKLGLITKVVNITNVIKKKIASDMVSVAAKYNQKLDSDFINKLEIKNVNGDKPENKEQNNNKPKKITMDLKKLRAEHPELFAQAVNEGVNQENERVKAWMVFNDTDPKAVAEGINGGESISASKITELTVKKVSKDTLAAMEKDNANPTSTKEVSPEKEEKSDLEKLEARLDTELNINPKKQ